MIQKFILLISTLLVAGLLVSCQSCPDKTQEPAKVDREGIRKVFFDNQRTIRSCFEKELKKEPNLAGIIKLDFDIAEGGVVKRAKVLEVSSLKNKKVHKCLLSNLMKWTFPEPKGETEVNVIYPLAFAAKKRQK